MNEETTQAGGCPVEMETGRGLFGITTVEDFFQKVCVKNYARIEEDIDDPGAAMNCILSLYHLHEWVWWGIVKLTECRLLSAFLHGAKPLKLHKAAIDNLPRFRSESG